MPFTKNGDYCSALEADAAMRYINPRLTLTLTLTLTFVTHGSK